MKHFLRHSALLVAFLYAFVTLMLSVVHHHASDFEGNELSGSYQEADIFCQICHTFQSQDVAEPQVIAATFTIECFITEVGTLSNPIQPLTHFSNRAPPQLA